MQALLTFGVISGFSKKVENSAWILRKNVPPSHNLHHLISTHKYDTNVANIIVN